jgi:hypothetical protein
MTANRGPTHIHTPQPTASQGTAIGNFLVVPSAIIQNSVSNAAAARCTACTKPNPNPSQQPAAGRGVYIATWYAVRSAWRQATRGTNYEHEHGHGLPGPKSTRPHGDIPAASRRPVTEHSKRRGQWIASGHAQELFFFLQTQDFWRCRAPCSITTCCYLLANTQGPSAVWALSRQMLMLLCLQV